MTVNDAIWRSMTEAEQAAALAAVATRPVPRPGEFKLDDTGNAERLVARFGDDIRYDHTDGRWLVWTVTAEGGGFWKADADGAVQRKAKETVRKIYDELTAAASAGKDEQAEAIARWAIRSGGEARRNAMLNLARVEETIAVTRDQLDAAPLLLNCLNGTLDLRTCELRPACRDDLLTYTLPTVYDPAAVCPRFDRFMHDIQPAADMRDHLARFAGAALSGQVINRPLAFWLGAGANGKSTMLELLLALLGPLGHKTRAEAVMMHRRGSTPDEVAALAGKRLVVASELSGGRLDEALVKDLTGGDTISARHLYGRPFTFRPAFGLVLYGNTRPRIVGTDEGIWRRVQIVPFDVTIPPDKRDPQLLDQLRAELPGVLAWAVRGWKAWQRDGFAPPAAVEAATTAYRVESDLVGQFIAARCVTGPDKAVRAGELYDAFRGWVEATGEQLISLRRFGDSIRERGIEKRNTARGFEYRGIGLVAGEVKP